MSIDEAIHTSLPGAPPTVFFDPIVSFCVIITLLIQGFPTPYKSLKLGETL